MNLSLSASLLALIASCRQNDQAPSVEVQPRAEQQTASNPNTVPSPSQPKPTTARLVLRPVGAPEITVDVEVARTPTEREVGLMFRRELAETRGMIFVFPAPEHQAFWMHNTLIALDMIFITPEKKVLGVVKQAAPRTDTPREVPGESMYVLEVAGGFADRHQIREGTSIEFVNVPIAVQ